MIKSHLERVIRVEPLETRLHFAAGDLDDTFSSNGRLAADVAGLPNYMGGMAVQLDGKIIVAGATDVGIGSNIVLARFDTDGTTDRTFGPGGSDGDGRITKDFAGFQETVTCMALQRDGRILVAGQTTFQLKTQAFIARFNRDGSIDTNFDGDGFALPNFGTLGSVINDIAVQSDGNIVVVGTIPTPQDPNKKNICYARLTKFGSPDFTFSGSGSGVLDMGSTGDKGNAVAIQDDGKIIITGYGDSDTSTSNGEAFVLRLMPDGTLDMDFDTDGKNFFPDRFDGQETSANDVAISASGNIVLAGQNGDYAYTWLVDPDGSSSSSGGRKFGSGGKFNSIAITADNVVTAVGSAFISGSYLPIVWQSSVIGSSPLSNKTISQFTSFSTANWQYGMELAIQPDGKLLIGGTTDVNSKGTTKADFGLARLLAFDDGVASVSGRIFKDRNGNGVRNKNDAGHAAIRVYLDQDKDGKFDSKTEPSVLTDANGKYTLPGLPAGPYRVRQIIPRGFRRSFPTKTFYNMTLDASENKAGRDFGNTTKALLAGRVFRDDDGDGRFDAGEQGMKKFTVYIDANGNGKLDDDEKSVLTDETGRWSFVFDAADDVLVRVVRRSGFEATTRLRVRVDLNRGEDSSRHLFGLRRV